MKQFLFVYEDTYEYLLLRYTPRVERICIEDKIFENGITDWEVIQEAKESEITKEWRSRHSQEECYYTRRLIRIFQVARELIIPNIRENVPSSESNSVDTLTADEEDS